MKIICPDCEKELPEGKKFCPTCGTPGLNEEEYERYKCALDNADTDAFEHASGIEINLNKTVHSPELVDKTDCSNESEEETEREKSTPNENDSECVSCCNNCDHCTDDDFEDIRFWPIGISKTNLIKAAIGITCFAGVITFVIRYLRRKK